jgi:mRNA interferase MazF
VTFEGKQGLILLDQIRILDKSRLVRRLGIVTKPTLSATLVVLREIFEE